MKHLLSTPICTDDFGCLVFRCQYTDAVVQYPDFIFIGACTPQVKGDYVCAPDARPAYKLSKAVFNEMDANCNTCRNLERIPFAKQHAANVMKGVCLLTSKPVTFHPDDYMGMPCWSAR